VTDGNAASGHSRFEPSPEGLACVDKDRTFSRDWRDDFKPVFWRKRSQKCAEVLVPRRVPPEHLEGAYVSCGEAKQAFKDLGTELSVTVDPDLFFLP
jgi:ssDNA thymidine ADP-ribosyltransferase, DarT